MKVPKSPNLAKIFHIRNTNQIPPSEFAKTVSKTDAAMSKFAKYTGQHYENGEQTLFYKYNDFTITIIISEVGS